MSSGIATIVHVPYSEVLLNLSTRMALGMVVGAQGLGIVSMAAAASGGNAAPHRQGSQTACSIIDQAELERLTGLKDLLGRGPVPADPADLPKGRSECEYLGLTFSLSSPVSTDAFARTRAIGAKGGTKIESVAGVGDEAFYWWDSKAGSQGGILQPGRDRRTRRESGAHGARPDVERLGGIGEAAAAHDREIPRAEGAVA